MSRFLFVVPPLFGHTNPTVGMAAELVHRGHRVAWAGHEEFTRRLTGADAEIFDCAILDVEQTQRPADLKGPAALKFLWERFFVPLADTMAPGVAAAIERFRPDVVVADQQAIAGGLIAERFGLPWMTSATTSAELVDPLAGMPKVHAWLMELIEQLRGRIGDPLGTADPRFSPHGVLALTTRELVGEIAIPGERVHFVGPSIAPRPSISDFPWDWLDPDRRTVLISVGTANADAGEPFLNECADAVRERSDELRAVIVDPGGCVRDAGANILVREFVPQLELLSKVDAVVCHAGHNTVCEALWHGVPLVVAPIRDDQPIVADQVVRSGAGVRVRFGRVTAAQLGAAIDTVLDESSGRRARAAKIRRSFRAAGGAAAAADRLVELLPQRSAVG